MFSTLTIKTNIVAMKFCGLPLLVLLTLFIWISILSTGTDAQLNNKKKQQQQPGTFKGKDGDEHFNIHAKENNDDTEYGIDRQNRGPDGKKSLNQNDQQHHDVDFDKNNIHRRNRGPHGHHNRTGVHDKKKGFHRHHHNSNESSPSRDLNRKQWKLNKHKDGKDKKHGEHISPCYKDGQRLPGCKDHRKHFAQRREQKHRERRPNHNEELNQNEIHGKNKEHADHQQGELEQKPHH
ncbi:unnamed protein product [Adineta steineri]|uniref:Uncharacterized protein n=1 Tax=Adineta steineri TaxID=433720 RepID=A0A813XCI9_9BILA|nr:unnamed protein product [Adineta steineri]CAF3734900.1 unnamed protein product [Adineta steineri]